MDEIKGIPVDAILHRSLRELAQSAMDNYGVCICGVSFEWIDVSTVSKHERRITVVSVETETASESDASALSE